MDKKFAYIILGIVVFLVYASVYVVIKGVFDSLGIH